MVNYDPEKKFKPGGLTRTITRFIVIFSVSVTGKMS